MIATKLKDLQRLYKAIECHATFIFYFNIIVYGLFKKMLSWCNISHLDVYSYGRQWESITWIALDFVMILVLGYVLENGKDNK